MKTTYIILPLLCICMAVAAQDDVKIHQHAEDSTDVFFRHLNLNEVTVTGVTGDTKLKHSTAPISVVTPQELRSTASINIIDAISHQPGVSQLTTGGSISKPIIRGLGYNRVVVMSEGVRQEGQQWGDEHGVEVDGSSVNSVEILKGPASLMYGSDAMAGVVILHAQPTLAEGEMRANVSSEYQTNNGLFGYNLSLAGNQKGLVWDARYSDKMAHSFKNKYDGYVPGSQFRERAGRLMLGLNKAWGHSRLIWTAYHLTPGIVEGERDSETGELEHAEGWSAHQYGKSLPFQQVKHYKAVLDNAFALQGGKLNVLLGYQQNRRKEYEEAESPNDYGLFLKLHTLNYNVHYVTPHLGNWKITAGVGGMYQKSVNGGEEFLIPDYSLFDFGVFATTHADLGRWDVNGGVRFDNRHMNGRELEDDGKIRFEAFKRNFRGLTASVGAVFHATDRLDLRANVARGFRAPNISELSSNGVHEGSVRYELGNVGLKPEHSLQFDLGVEFESPVVACKLDLFANLIDNYIFIHRVADVVDPEYMTYRYDAGDSRLMGGELSIDVHPLHALHLGTSLSYVSAIRLHQPRESRYLPFTPAPRWTLDAKYEINHDGRVFSNAFVAAQWDYYFKQNHYYSADETETATPAYGLLNLSAGTDVMIHGRRAMSFYFTAQNVTNKVYQSHLSRLKYADVNPLTGERGVFNMGRNFVFKLIVPIEWR